MELGFWLRLRLRVRLRIGRHIFCVSVGMDLEV